MAKIQITKENWRKFTKSALMPGSKKIPTVQENEQLRINTALLEECNLMYSSLQSMRDEDKENSDYFFGDQLNRLVPDPDHEGSMITIERYAISQGMTPLKMNLITSRIRSMVGVYGKKKLDDLAIARDKDKAALGEVMSAAIQCVYQNNNLYRINTDGYREFLLFAHPCFRVGYDFDSEKKISDVYCDLEDTDYMFWDDNTSGLYFKNVSTIGKLHEFSLMEILSKFAKTPQMRRQIMEAYGNVRQKFPIGQQFSAERSNRKMSFFTPKDDNKFRVIEVWRKEEHEVYVCNDPLGDEPYTVDIDQLDSILAENSRRKAEIHMYGGDPDDAATIDFEYRVDTEWVVRYLTPCGHVLYQAVSPYAHGSHPWAIGGYPMVKGRVQSLVHDLKPAQDMVNRMVMRIEFTRMNQAKGFGIVDQDVLDQSGVTLDEFARKYTSPKGVIGLRCSKDGGVNNVFARFTDEGGTNSDMQMLMQYIDMINQQSGSTEASRGEQGGSHESASRYMQEAENSNNNVADGEMWFNGLLFVRDFKILNLIQQYYNGTRYLALAGKDYDEQAKQYDSEKIKNTIFDLSLVQQPSSGVVRLMLNDTINSMLQVGAIDGDTALELLQDYGADRILKVKRKNEELRAQQQQAMMQQQAAMQQPQEQQVAQ